MAKLNTQAKAAESLPTTIELEIPLTFTLHRSPNGTWLPVVSGGGEGKACMLAQANIAPRGELSAAICAALGLTDGSGAMVTGNVNVFLPRNKVPAEVWQKAVDRAKARAESKPTPGSAGSVASKLTLG